MLTTNYTYLLYSLFLVIVMSADNFYKNTQHCNDSTTHVSDEGAILNEDSMPCLFQVPNGNQDNYQKASGTSLNSMKFNEGLPGYKEDSVIYATLSHGELFQRTKPPEETELTEYAIIRLKN